MEKKSVKVLVIEGDPGYFTLLNERLSKSQNPHFELIRSKLLQSGLERLRGGDIDAVLLELMLPDSQGYLSFKAVHEAFPTIPIIVLTQTMDNELASKIISEGAQDYLIKGSFDREGLVKSICFAIKRSQIQTELQMYFLQNEASRRVTYDREERFRSLVTNIPGAIYRYQAQENGSWAIEFISAMIRQIVGIPDNNLMASDIAKYYELVLPQDLPVLREAVEKAIQEGTAYALDYRVRHVDGSFRWVHDQGRGLKDEAGKVTHIDGVIFDTTERTKEKERFNKLVYYDALTNLPNRDLFVDRLDQAINLARHRKETGAVLVLDLDHFKRINDTLGHAIGDQLIRAVAVKLSKTVYDSDTISRIGGGSFVVLLPRLAKGENAENIANKILAAFRVPFLIDKHELFTTCSIGITLFPNDGETSAALMKNADSAMHLAKERGKDRYQFYSSAIANNSFERLVLENSLRRAVERNEFRLYYQPQLDIRSGKVVGVEALIRWQHPDLGFIPPMEFISIAEETGLIHSIGEWVLRTACEQKKAWDKQGLHSLRVGVNLSAQQFHHENLVDLIGNILKKIDLDPKELDLELTESTIMTQLEETTETLRKFREMGIHISIDDFGTGYSSLMYLKTFPIDMIKIDKSFVRDVTTDQDDRAITQAIISMAHSLKLEVIAEGVETGAQLEIMKAQDCDMIQGYLFSKPIPPEEVYPLLVNDTGQKVVSGIIR